MEGESISPFQIIIDCPFAAFAQNEMEGPIDNKYSLCLANDYEDGAWMIDAFMEHIWDNIAETALSAEERLALGSRPSTLLSSAAKNLRITDKELTGGEIAEILLYSVMRHHYKALPVVPKIFYKQNTNDYAKGADSVHIVLEQNGSFSYWLGEAKFYDSLDDERLNTIVQSVKSTLTTKKIQKENTIVVGLKDLDMLNIPNETISNVKKLLGKDISVDTLKPHLHIPILLLHQCEILSDYKCIDEEYLNSIKAYYKDRAISYFKKQVLKCKDDIYLYNQISFHLILVPVPNKEEIVKRFIERAKVFR